MNTRIIVSFLIGAVIAGGAVLLATGMPATATPEEPVILAGVPDIRQAEYYSCGAASMQAVLCYWSLDAFETDLRLYLNTTPVHGTYPWDMVRVAEDLGLEAEWKDNLTIADLEASLRDGVPVIIDGQRFREPNKTWEESWAAGHYMVVIGVDDRSVYLEDPAVLGVRLVMDRDEFMQSWHDYEAELPIGPDSPKYYGVGVFIRGEAPAEWPAFVAWDWPLAWVPPAPRP
jgi:predicted double-glycine peptidase